MRRMQPEPEPQAPAFNTRTTLAAWKCGDCKATRSGWIEPNDFKTRRCMGIPKGGTHGTGRICGAAMVEIYREDAR